jgi:hypothetical protein
MIGRSGFPPGHNRLQLAVVANAPVGVKDRTVPESPRIGIRQSTIATTLEREHVDRNHP